MGKKFNWIIVFFIGICLIFFYQIFWGKVPFPGDLLISEYSPWKYMSFLGYTPGSYPEKFQYFDALRQMYPWTTFAISSLKSFQFPLWNPYNFSGSPLFANSQSAVLYPFHVLYFIFPQIIAWTLLVMLQPLLTSIFTYLFIRKIGVRKWGSILSSVAFSYSLFTNVFLEYNTLGHVILFLPLLLWLSELLFEKKTFLRITLFVAAIACAAFAGHIQIFGFVLLYVVAYILFKLFLTKTWNKNSVFFLILFSLGIGVSLVQLLPTLELINNAARSNQEYTVLLKNLLLQGYQLILFLSPDIFGNPATKNYLLPDSYPGNAIYIGLIPFILSIFAATFWKKNAFISFFALSVLSLLFLFVHTPVTQIMYRYPVPLFSTGSPTNAIFLLSFSLSVLAGFGLDQFLAGKQKKFFSVSLSTFLFFLFALEVFHIGHIAFLLKNVLYSVGIFLLLLILSISSLFFTKYKKVVAILFILIAVFDLFYFFQKFNPFVKPVLVFPQTPLITFLKNHAEEGRFWSYGDMAIVPNFATQYSLYDVNGYDPLYPKQYGEFINSVKNGRISNQFSDQDRSDAMLPGAFSATDLLSNKNELKVLNLLNVKFIIAREDSKTYLLPTDTFTLLFKSNGQQVFENKKALPRAFLVYQTKQYSSDKEFGKLFFSSPFNPGKEVLLTNNFHLSGSGSGSAVVAFYSPNKVIIKTTSSSSGILVLSDTYYPGWKATIDRKEVDIFRVDYTFRGILVPSGNHTITFIYQPSSFSVGLSLSILSIVATLGGAFILSKKKYEKIS